MTQVTLHQLDNIYEHLRDAIKIGVFEVKRQNTECFLVYQTRNGVWTMSPPSLLTSGGREVHLSGYTLQSPTFLNL